MRTIFVTSFHVLISRNILAAGLPRRLVDGGARVVVLVPDYKAPYFRERFGGPGIEILGVDANAPTKTLRGRFFKRLAQNMLDTSTVELKQKQRRFLHRQRVAYYCFWLPARLAWHVPGAVPLVRMLDRALAPSCPLEVLLERERPDLVFATDIQNENDVALLQGASRRGIPTVGMVRSWDNLTNYLLRIIPGVLLVGNTLEREEAVRYHGVPAGRIRIVGIPHYDRYRSLPKAPRDDFLRSLGLDPQKKLIVFTPVGDRYIRNSDSDRSVMDLLAAMPEVNVIVRFPPADTVSHTGDFTPPPHMHFDRPGVAFDASAAHREVSEEDDRRLMHELYHADLVITGPSSIALDASLFGKPIIAVNLSRGERPYLEGIIGYDYVHFGYLRERAALALARSGGELRDFIRRYLADSSHDAAGRAAVVRDLCGPADGRSAERIVDALGPSR